jgi:hypothetical protein
VASSLLWRAPVGGAIGIVGGHARAGQPVVGHFHFLAHALEAAAAFRVVLAFALLTDDAALLVGGVGHAALVGSRLWPTPVCHCALSSCTSRGRRRASASASRCSRLAIRFMVITRSRICARWRITDQAQPAAAIVDRLQSLLLGLLAGDCPAEQSHRRASCCGSLRWRSAPQRSTGRLINRLIALAVCSRRHRRLLWHRLGDERGLDVRHVTFDALEPMGHAVAVAGVVRVRLLLRFGHWRLTNRQSETDCGCRASVSSRLLAQLNTEH